MKLSDLSTYPKIPEDTRFSIENQYDEIMEAKLYERPYDALCWLEDFYQDKINEKIKDGTFSLEKNSDIILMRTFCTLLALDCLTEERIDNWDYWVDKIKDTPKITENDIDILRSLTEEQVREIFN